ncbi:hypothetical protein A2957_03410 [Candidatus Roizmanbacteria bacterium RIFCSPLOWO2_01_FULL_38_11]|uniref:Membrane insertase YidC/Oxa/ALB C-terminal domain-containing protein n=1 Tax=Candidatus Roizmanbacteria bacterium RIFCSPLOWO2_01_FULL_38_11 TaxID=1802060 RepID=A0A1F7IP47_9BACT|nr:MAG: hypothetical protein A2957_03410 [Candidatus Roizmanbacteria bacterium RIFCSPLOWO2_01_FULL_38_11]
MGELFNTILVNPITNILLFFNYIFETIRLPGAFGFSIIALTAFIRLLFHPFYKKQIDMTTKMAELKPEMDRLSKKYKNDKQRLQQEQLKLYQQKGINPAAGCLTALLQIPIFLALYQVLQKFLQNNLQTIMNQVNLSAYVDFIRVKVIDTNFFIYDLRIAPSHFKENGYHYLIIPIITAFLQYYQTKLQTPAAAPKKDVQKDNKDGKKGSEDMQQIMSGQMKVMFPLMIGYFSYILPVGLALYWNIFSLFSIVQIKLPLWRKKRALKN